MVADLVYELPKDDGYTDDECGGYGDDYFINDKGELESYCPYCAMNPANDDWDD